MISPQHLEPRFRSPLPDGGDVATPRSEQRQVDFEAEFFGALLDAKPDYVDAALALADAELARRRPRRAVDLAETAKRARPMCARVQFLLACAHGSVGALEPAFTALRRALELGFAAFDRLLEEPALAKLRSDRRLVDLIEEFGGVRD